MTPEIKSAIEQLGKDNATFVEAVKTGQTELADKIGKDLLEQKTKIEALETALARSAVVEGVKESREVSAHRKAFKTFMTTGNDTELRTVAGIIATPADGGYAVPQNIDSNVTRLLQETSDIRPIAKIVTIGGSTGYIHNISQANAAGGWVAESDARATTNSPTLGQVVIVPGELYAEPEASQQLIEDANFDVEAWYANEVSDIIARTENTAFVVGNGTNKPKGFLAYTTNDLGSNAPDYTKLNTVTSTTAQAITYEDIEALIYNLKPAYRKGGVFVMNRAILQKVMGLKSTTGFPLWQPSLQAGQPDMLAGYPVKEFSDMPSTLVGTGSPLSTPLAIVFGDFSKGYTVVDRVGLSTLRDPYSHKGFVQFYTRKRVGGGLEDGTALVALKVKQS